MGIRENLDIVNALIEVAYKKYAPTYDLKSFVEELRNAFVGHFVNSPEILAFAGSDNERKVLESDSPQEFASVVDAHHYYATNLLRGLVSKLPDALEIQITVIFRAIDYNTKLLEERRPVNS